MRIYSDQIGWAVRLAGLAGRAVRHEHKHFGFEDGGGMALGGGESHSTANASQRGQGAPSIGARCAVLCCAKHAFTTLLFAVHTG